MSPFLILSREKLQLFAECRRRFQLRYVSEAPWPKAPPGAEVAAQLERGHRFHRLLERHFLGLAIEEDEPRGDPVLASWWRRFTLEGPDLRNGRAMPEVTLTVPVGDLLLHGRFDLLLFTENEGRIYDWKTGRPPDTSSATEEWQARLYLALLAEGCAELGSSLSPAQLSLTFWYVQAPDRSRHIQYSTADHERNWAELRSMAAEISSLLPVNIWPLVEEWSTCRSCLFQAICGRQEAGRTQPEVNWEDDDIRQGPLESLEPAPI